MIKNDMSKLNKFQKEQVEFLKKVIKDKNEVELRNMRDGIVIMGDLHQMQVRGNGNDEEFFRSHEDMSVLKNAIDERLREIGAVVY